MYANGLTKYLREKAVGPYLQYRGSWGSQGRFSTFEHFMAERPDGGERLLNADKKPVTFRCLMAEALLDINNVTFNELVQRQDDLRLLAGLMIEDFFIKGFTSTRNGAPPLWMRLCFQTGVPSKAEGAKRGKLAFEGDPGYTAEAEDFPVANLSRGYEDIYWGKAGIQIRITEEFLAASPISIAEPWLVEIGRYNQHWQTRRAVQVLVNGDLANGANACPLIGVADTGEGFQDGDFDNLWSKGDEIGEGWYVLLAERLTANEIKALPIFRNRQQGTPRVALVSDGEPVGNVQLAVSSEVASGHVIGVDTTHAMRQRVFMPPMVKHVDRPENWTQGIVVGWSDAFERIGDKAVVGIDKSLAYADHDFPTWFEVGQNRP